MYVSYVYRFEWDRSVQQARFPVWDWSKSTFDHVHLLPPETPKDPFRTTETEATACLLIYDMGFHSGTP
jgi:hypothetical protein